MVIFDGLVNLLAVLPKHIACFIFVAMTDAKFFVGTKVITPLGVGTVTMTRFSSRKGGKYYVVGNGFERYFRFEELEFENPPIEDASMSQPVKDIAWQPACSKAHYHSYGIAQENLRRIMYKSLRKTKPIRAYRCYHCGLWHLTSKPLPDVKTVVSAGAVVKVKKKQGRKYRVVIGQ